MLDITTRVAINHSHDSSCTNWMILRVELSGWEFTDSVARQSNVAMDKLKK